VTSLGVGGVVQPSGMVGNGSNLFVGYPMNCYYGYKADGVFLDNSEVSSWADMTAVNKAPVAGDIRYKNLFDDGTTKSKVTTADMTYLGSTIPKFNYSATLEMGYGGIDFKLLLQGVAKVNGLLNGYAGYGLYNGGNVQYWQLNGTWSNDKTNRYPVYPRLQTVSTSGGPNYILSDYWVLNAAYCRIKNLQLGYSLPKAILEKSNINRLRFYISCDNLATFSHYRKGWDPEINSGGSYYPIMATYSFGVNVDF
jgi:hypothetical protein